MSDHLDPFEGADEDAVAGYLIGCAVTGVLVVLVLVALLFGVPAALWLTWWVFA